MRRTTAVRWAVLAVAASAAACAGKGTARDAGRDANGPDEAVADPGPGTDVRADAGPEAAADAQPGDPGAARDDADAPGGDLPPADAPPDAAPDASADLTADAIVDAPADGSPDVPPVDPWEGLAGTGLPLQQIAGVASQMSTNAAQNDQRDFEYAQYAPYPGFRMRNGHRFDDVEPARDDWHFERVSGSVDGAIPGGSKVLMGLDYGVSWAEVDEVTDTLDIDAFAGYAGAMAGAFCDTVKEYEIWNEENLARFWTPAANPARYADLVIAAAGAIRTACPDATVMFGGMSSYDDVDLFDTWGFLRRALAARPGLCDAFDAVALHPYTWFQFDPPEHDEYVSDGVVKPSQTAMVHLADDILRQAGCGEKPFYFTEVGWPSYDLTEDQVARYAARSLLLTARDGVRAWCWYTFWDREPTSEGIRPHENYFGLFGWPGPDGTVRRAKPAWTALTTALDLLGHDRFARDFGPSLGLPNDVYVLAFVDDAGRTTLALWDGREVPDVTPDGDTPGGPDTTFDLDLPLPAGTVATALTAIDGTALPSPGAGPTARLVLTPSVQYLQVDSGSR